MREEWSDFPGLFPKEDHLEADKVGKSRAPGPECHTPVTGHYSSVCESLDMPNKTLGGSVSPSDIIVVGPPACRAPACQELGATPRGRLPFNPGFVTTYQYGARSASFGCQIAGLSTTPRSRISARGCPKSMTGSPANDCAAFDSNGRTVEELGTRSILTASTMIITITFKRVRIVSFDPIGNARSVFLRQSNVGT